MLNVASGVPSVFSRTRAPACPAVKLLVLPTSTLPSSCTAKLPIWRRVPGVSDAKEGSSVPLAFRRARASVGVPL